MNLLSGAKKKNSFYLPCTQHHSYSTNCPQPFTGSYNTNMYSIHHLLYYLDFFTAGTPASQECLNKLSAMPSLHHLSHQKMRVPPPVSGILIDTSTMTVSITDEHKQDLISSLQSLLQDFKCTKC